MGFSLVSCTLLIRRVFGYQPLQSLRIISCRKGHQNPQSTGYKNILKRCCHSSSAKHSKFESCHLNSVKDMNVITTVEKKNAAEKGEDADDQKQEKGGPEFEQEPDKPGNGGPKPLSKRALRRVARAQKHKELKKKKKAQALLLTQKDDAGYSLEELEDSSYYFENGLRKVYPYHFVFATHAKRRWVGRTIYDVLEREFGFDQTEHLTKAFDNGLIHVNSRQATSNYILRDNDYISHKIHRHENAVTAAPIEIIEENENVVVINKPSSIPCHPCGRYRFNSVVFILGKEMGLTNLRNIYRLDRLTSGVLILGKSIETTKMLMDQVVARQVQKEYVCRVMGRFPDGTVKVDQPLEALSNKLRLQVVSPTGKSSQTSFTRLSYNGKSSVVRCVPHTGRTHQIRVHLQYLGHPIINDAFYNNEAWGPNKGKGGIYELPFDQVCERILREHHVTLWDGGDNPLYEQKLKEMEAVELANAGPSQPKASDACALGDKDEASGEHQSGSTACTSSEGNNSQIITMATDSEPPPKKRKEENLNESICASSSSSENFPVASEVTNDPSRNNSSNSTVCLSTTSDTGKDAEDHSALQHDTSDTDKRSIQNDKRSMTTESQSSQGSIQRPNFDVSKWTVDPACELCKKLSIDPTEKDLVMFLHAIKYQGPGWQYETAPPDWTKDDWNREEEFEVSSLPFDDTR